MKNIRLLFFPIFLLFSSAQSFALTYDFDLSQGGFITAGTPDSIFRDEEPSIFETRTFDSSAGDFATLFISNGFVSFSAAASGGSDASPLEVGALLFDFNDFQIENVGRPLNPETGNPLSSEEILADLSILGRFTLSLLPFDFNFLNANPEDLYSAGANPNGPRKSGNEGNGLIVNVENAINPLIGRSVSGSCSPGSGVGYTLLPENFSLGGTCDDLGLRIVIPGSATLRGSTPAEVPEPRTILLLAMGCILLVYRKRGLYN